MTQEANEHADILKAIWPDGMPERDRLIVEGLLPDRRRVALARLEAVWRAENGEPWKPLAERIGLSRAAFYNLRAAWRERSLEGVVPNERRIPRRLSIEAEAPIRIAARELLRSVGPDGRNIDLAKELLADFSEAFGGNTEQTRLQAAERLVRHERKALSFDAHFLQTHFGRRLVIDLSAVAVLLEGEGELAVAAVCLEAASGLVLGSALNRLSTASEIEREAADRAWRFIWKNRLDRSIESWPPCHLDMMLPPEFDGSRDQQGLERATQSLTLRQSGSYAFGQEILQRIGPRMGRLSFAPRKTLQVDAAGFAQSRSNIVLPPEAAATHWDREVLRHNEPIITAIKSAGLWNAGSSEGRMIAVLEAIDAYLI